MIDWVGLTEKALEAAITVLEDSGPLVSNDEYYLFLEMLRDLVRFGCDDTYDGVLTLHARMLDWEKEGKHAPAIPEERAEELALLRRVLAGWRAVNDLTAA
jgi:hypothetical protein